MKVLRNLVVVMIDMTTVRVSSDKAGQLIDLSDSASVPIWRFFLSRNRFSFPFQEIIRLGPHLKVAPLSFFIWRTEHRRTAFGNTHKCIGLSFVICHLTYSKVFHTMNEWRMMRFSYPTRSLSTVVDSALLLLPDIGDNNFILWTSFMMFCLSPSDRFVKIYYQFNARVGRCSPNIVWEKFLK